MIRAFSNIKDNIQVMSSTEMQLKMIEERLKIVKAEAQKVLNEKSRVS